MLLYLMPSMPSMAGLRPKTLYHPPVRWLGAYPVPCRQCEEDDTQGRPVQSCETQQHSRTSAWSHCGPAGWCLNRHFQHVPEPGYYPTVLQGHHKKLNDYSPVALALVIMHWAATPEPYYKPNPPTLDTMQFVCSKNRSTGISHAVHLSHKVTKTKEMILKGLCKIKFCF